MCKLCWCTLSLSLRLPQAHVMFVQIDRCIEMDRWMDGQTDGRTDGWMEGCIVRYTDRHR